LGNVSAVLRYEPVVATARQDMQTGLDQGKTMADRAGLKIVGFIFATVTLAVMLTSVQVVKSHADGGDSVETTASISR
jgi:hypothetical protein